MARQATTARQSRDTRRGSAARKLSGGRRHACRRLLESVSVAIVRAVFPGDLLRNADSTYRRAYRTLCSTKCSGVRTGVPATWVDERIFESVTYTRLRVQPGEPSQLVSPCTRPSQGDSSAKPMTALAVYHAVTSGLSLYRPSPHHVGVHFGVPTQLREAVPQECRSPRSSPST
jgi:hypothetical protein